MFSMFGRTGASTKNGPHRPENVGQQRDILWPGDGLRTLYCETRTLRRYLLTNFLNRKFYVRTPHIYICTEQGLIGFKSGRVFSSIHQ